MNTQAASARINAICTHNQSRERGYFIGFEVLNIRAAARTPTAIPKTATPRWACASSSSTTLAPMAAIRMNCHPHARPSNVPTRISRSPISNVRMLEPERVATTSTAMRIPIQEKTLALIAESPYAYLMILNEPITVSSNCLSESEN